MKFLADENFEGAIYRGLLRRSPDLDIVRVQDVGLSRTHDPEILAWASDEGRIMLTHDRRTMPGFAYERMATGESIASIIVMRATIPVSEAIEDILLINACSTADEWVNQVQDLPL
jgi:predicted nuclease of predicted toxin-antitoxin system